MLLGKNQDGEYQLSLKGLNSAETQNLRVATLAEKCTFSVTEENVIYCAVPTSLDGETPNHWYQGVASFNDLFYLINTETARRFQIFDPTTFGEKEMDLTRLKIDPGEQFIAFQDKKTLTLWLYALATNI